ncbi:hypothetical protein Ga0061079_104111 [Apibacter mensalis]|uniref:Uncharacterized protein n=1 Tax=Apibacter mensalis TaxID=1586267 RepID=A0A0X3ANR3_9FLAO|nr:hypothetical protein [Apibacter mensalis]CVK15992.1 hypothetical protein Ga0061079_104111 [Apibacter mensalis]
MKNSDFSNEKINPKNFLTFLHALVTIPNYENLGYTLTSIRNIAQTALLAESKCKKLTLCHDPLDL